MKYTQLCLVGLALTLGGAACQSSAPANNTASANANNTNAANATATPKAATPDLSTPTKSAIIFYQGVKTKDAAKIKATLSQKTIDEAEKQAQDTGKTIMDTIMQSAPPPALLNTKNEKINGDMATLEVTGLDEKHPDKAEIFYFIKEGNDWKVDLFHDVKNNKKETMPKK